MAQLKRKQNIAPCKSPNDECFTVSIIIMHTYTLQWLVDGFLGYLDNWEEEVADQPGVPRKEQKRMCLSRETLQGLRITAKSVQYRGFP